MMILFSLYDDTSSLLSYYMMILLHYMMILLHYMMILFRPQ